MPKVKYQGQIFDIPKVEIFDDYAIADWGSYQRIIPREEFEQYELISE